jgi:hypothetical protein
MQDFFSSIFGGLFNPTPPAPQQQAPLDVQGIVFRAGEGARWQDEWRHAETPQDLAMMGGPEIPAEMWGQPKQRDPVPTTTVGHGPAAGPSKVEIQPLDTIVSDTLDTTEVEINRDGVVTTTTEVPTVAEPTPVPTDRPPHIPPNLPTVQPTPPPRGLSDIVRGALTPQPKVQWSGPMTKTSIEEASQKAAKKIVDSEARRDGYGRIAVYGLPSNDGGGAYEVAGINQKYHPKMAAGLASLIKQGKHDEAEQRARDYIINYTNGSAKHFDNPGIQYLVRDIAFNRGPGGANAALRLAIGDNPKNKTQAWKTLNGDEIARAKEFAQRDPVAFVQALTEARAAYEYRFVGKRPNLDRGLRNRWADGQKNALELMK